MTKLSQLSIPMILIIGSIPDARYDTRHVTVGSDDCGSAPSWRVESDCGGIYFLPCDTGNGRSQCREADTFRILTSRPCRRFCFCWVRPFRSRYLLLRFKFLMRYIKKNDFKVFGWYRIALGIIVFLFFGIQAILS